MIPTHSPQIYWLFGQPTAGRAVLAQALCDHCKNSGGNVTLLNGDDFRAGLCEDLGFTEADHLEKVRRGAHVAKTHTATGATVICSFLTPKESHRELVRQILGVDVHLIHVQCALLGCKICQEGEKECATTAFDSLSAGPDDFDPPVGTDDVVISTHDRSLAASLQGLSQITSNASGEPVKVKPDDKSRVVSVAAGGGLSAREMEVMSLLSQGLRHKEMAAHLGISTTTVRTHLERACVKLSANSRTEAVVRFVALHPPTP